MCDCFKPRGETYIENRVVDKFNILHVFDKIDVYYTQDTTVTSCSVKVVTGRNLMSSITTQIVNGELQIQNGNKCDFVRGNHNDVTVYITSPHTTYFIQDGVGTIYGTNIIKQDTVDCKLTNSGDIKLNVSSPLVVSHMHGAGDLYLNGNAQNFYSNGIGQGFVNAQNLVTNYTYMYYGSNGEAHVNVNTTGTLEVVLASTGNIYYSGNPSVINKSGTGSGTLIHD